MDEVRKILQTFCNLAGSQWTSLEWVWMRIVYILKFIEFFGSIKDAITVIMPACDQVVV